MKKALILALFLYTHSLFAQLREFGIGLGLSTNTAPVGNLIFRGDKMIPNYAATLKFLFTSKTNWQFGLDGHVMEISSKSSVKYVGGFENNGLYIDTIGGDDRKLVYSKFGVVVCFVANKKFIFNNKNAMYAGLALGYASARNNSRKYYPNESYKGPDGGEGFVGGMQLGYMGHLSSRVIFNVDAALRYCRFDFDAKAPHKKYELLYYSVVTFPVTVGIRYVLFNPNRDGLVEGTYDVKRNRYY